ncbi:MAG: hypothetical protein AMXMBFR34_43770 [Myxococcaceae bacterium]
MGPSGDAGPAGPSAAKVFDIRVESPDVLVGAIQSVTIPANGRPVANFSIRDSIGRGAVGLTAGSSGQVRFTIAKLTPGAMGNSSAWQSYINTVSTWDAGAVMQATSERTGTLVDHGDGTYEYTFVTDVTMARNPVDMSAITYDATLTHRAVLQVSGGTVVDPQNVVFDFVPNGSAVSFTREVVDTDNCNTCHGALTAHGSRYEAKYCVTCHNPGTAMQANSVDMKVFIHKIHRGAHLPSVQAGGSYVLVGSRGTYDFSGVGFPQPINNCRKCHNGEAGAPNQTSEGNNWRKVPTREACGACHDDINWSTGAGHVAGAQSSNMGCAGCHTEAKVEKVHATETKSPNAPTLIVDDSGNPLTVFAYELGDVTADGTNHPVVKFKITRDGAAFDPTAALPAGITGGPSFLIAYAQPQSGLSTPGDYNNLGRSAAQPASVSLANLRAGTAGTLSGPDTSGFYTATFTGTNAWPAGATLRAVALQGYFSQTVTVGGASTTYGRHTTSVVKSVTGDAKRREVTVDSKCLSCHESLELHGGNRMNAVGVCVTCHVPNLSSSGRGMDPVLFSAQVRNATYPDGGLPTAEAHEASLAAYEYFEPTGDPATFTPPVDPLAWPEESNNFKDLVHGLHGSHARSTPFVFTRDRGTSGAYVFDWSHVTYPQVNGNCAACHTDTGFSVALPSTALPSTQRTTTGVAGETRAQILAARGTVPNSTDVVSSPTAASCSGCHDTVLAKAHMQQNGGAVDVSRGTYDTSGAIETCAVCHGDGKTADVAAMHPIP